MRREGQRCSASGRNPRGESEIAGFSSEREGGWGEGRKEVWTARSRRCQGMRIGAHTAGVLRGERREGREEEEQIDK